MTKIHARKNIIAKKAIALFGQHDPNVQLTEEQAAIRIQKWYKRWKFKK